MSQHFEIWWKTIRWFATMGFMLWFVILPLMPIYGLVRPWPQARERMHEEGITGLPLMIGAASHGEHRGAHWWKEKQRSYVVLPDSLQRSEIFIYSETEGSGIVGVRAELLRSRLLIPLVVLWILAGSFTAWRIRRWSTKEEPN